MQIEAQVQEHAAEAATEGFNAGAVIIEHVANSPIDHPLIHLPTVAGIDLSVTKHVFMLWVVAAVVFLAVTTAVRRYLRQDRLVPSGFMNALEAIVEFLRDSVVRPSIGDRWTPTWLPLVLTLFVFILAANAIGLIPIFEVLALLNHWVFHAGEASFFARLLHGGVVDDAKPPAAVALDRGENALEIVVQHLHGKLHPAIPQLGAGQQLPGAHPQDAEHRLEVGPGLDDLRIRAGVRMTIQDGLDFTEHGRGVFRRGPRAGEARLPLGKSGNQPVAGGQTAGQERVVAGDLQSDQAEFAAQHIEDVQQRVHIEQRLFAGLERRQIDNLDFGHRHRGM